jgi:molybdopterin converting factor small subunit
MQILEIVLYSHDERLRSIPFRLGRLNVITGESQSGKSALLEIVRYCLGSRELRIPAGIVSDKVSWFGLKLQLPKGSAFVARPSVPSGHQTTTVAMIRVGENVTTPTFDQLEVNTNSEAVIEILGRSLGIEENDAVLPETATRLPVEATLAHALFFCLQRQDEIASRDLLFHRQGEEFVSTHIRDVLPYFLGAMPSEFLVLQARLMASQESLRAAEAANQTRTVLAQSERDRSTSLLNEAADVGLIAPRDSDEESTETLRAWLAEAVESAESPEAAHLASGATFIDLRRQQSEIAERYRELRRTKSLIEGILGEQAQYSGELQRQIGRLSVVDLFPQEIDGAACPVCQQALTQQLPTIEEIRSDLQSLREEILSASSDEPRLTRLLTNVQEQQAATEEELHAVSESIEALAQQSEEVERLRELLNRQSYVRGRIDHYLRSLPELDRDSAWALEIQRLTAEIETLRDQLGFEAIRENVTSILNVIGGTMGDFASTLQLEYATSPVRIDPSRLTVVADTSTGTIPLSRMGSAANWVGYHLVTYLSLHQFFIEQDRPVPRFIVFDQPTQAFYPPDLPVDAEPTYTDADRMAVQRMFRLLYDTCAALAPELQVIVMDHARLDQEWFGESIVEEWRGGTKLVPADW